MHQHVHDKIQSNGTKTRSSSKKIALSDLEVLHTETFGRSQCVSVRPSVMSTMSWPWKVMMIRTMGHVRCVKMMKRKPQKNCIIINKIPRSPPLLTAVAKGLIWQNTMKQTMADQKSYMASLFHRSRQRSEYLLDPCQEWREEFYVLCDWLLEKGSRSALSILVRSTAHTTNWRDQLYSPIDH